MNIGDLVRVNENLLGVASGAFAIYLGEVRDPQYGTLARILHVRGKMMNVHFAHLREL